MLKSDYHHGQDIDLHKKKILDNPTDFYSDIIKILESLEYMGPFYDWPKKKQKECEQIYYGYEKRMLSYLVHGNDFKAKENLVSCFVKIYASLIYKYINWYNYSEYKGLYYTTEELETMIKSHLIDTIYKYVSKYQEVKIPFGSFLKRRIFIQFRGELQDHLRKIVLYEKWKPILYENTKCKDNLEKMYEYSSIESKMKMLKEYFLYEDSCQKLNEEDEEFFHNYLFVYYFIERRSLTKFIEITKLNPSKFVENIKNEVKIFRDKFNEYELMDAYSN
jgi:hypothetical protein